MTSAEFFRCGGPVTIKFGNGYLCENCVPDGEDNDPTEDVERAFGEWDTVDFSTTTPDTYPPFDRAQWMGRKEKFPFSPWGDRNHPAAADDEDARYKWGLSENYADSETVVIAEDDSRLDGRVFIQREDDPYAHVDGDDVRDPETARFTPR